MTHDLKQVIERVKAQPWYEKKEEILDMRGSVIVGMELHDNGDGAPTLDCTIYVQRTLGSGRDFDEAFVDLEKKLGINAPVAGEVIASTQ